MAIAETPKINHSQTEETLRYLELIVGGASQGYLSFWRGDSKLSGFCSLSTDFQEVVPRLLAVSQRADLYVGIGFRDRDLGKTARGTAKDIVGINCLWLDLDVSGEGHVKKALPANISEAEKFLGALEYRPSLVVQSGGGLHVYWIFREPWFFDTDEERRKAETLLRGWESHVLGLAKLRGWELDKTGDLARVLRIPGTLNFKYTPPARVAILRETDFRYNPSDFDGFGLGEHRTKALTTSGENIHEGKRNATLTSLAGSMRRKGLSENAILQALLVMNAERCNPPLGNAEVQAIAKSITRYEPGAKNQGGKKAKDDKKTRHTSLLIDEEMIYEQVYRDRQSLFISYRQGAGEIKEAPFVQLGEETIEPINGEDVELGAVKLPSEAVEYGDTLSLLSEIEKHVYAYLDVSPNYLKFAGYYILLSWLYDRFHTLPYLRALGDTGCGKSRFLDVIGGLCYKSISASGCVTPAPIYRMLRKWGGTLVLDEADMKNSDEYNEVVTILNCGFERGRPVIRATKDNPDKIQILPVYGPKVFATRRRFRDAALEARCLTEIMTETDRDHIPPVLGRRFFEEQQDLRNKLLFFRLRNFFLIDPEAKTNLCLDGIEPRLRQVSDAFISLFANQEAVLTSYKEFIEAHQRELIEQRASTKPGQVVETLFDLLGGFPVSMVSLVSTPMGYRALNVTGGDIGTRLDMKPQAVGQILKNLGLITHSVKIDGRSRRCILYEEKKLEKLWKRYVPKDETLSPVTLETIETIETRAGLTPSQQSILDAYDRGEYQEVIP